MPSTPEREIDAAIIGAGPAGASCAVWLARLGFRPLVIDAAGRVGGALARSPYRNDWLATSPAATGEVLAANIARSLEEAQVDMLLAVRVSRLDKTGTGFSIQLEDGGSVVADRVVLATGCVPDPGGLPESPDILVGPGAHVFHHDFRGLDVAVLGGGDNAFENAAFVRSKDARSVTVFARTVRARPDFVASVPGEDVVRGRYEIGGDGLTVNGRRFDRVLVMYGFRPDLSFLDVPPETDARGFPATAAATAETSVPGLYAIGEIAARMHPCVATALADGVVAAKAIEAAIRG